MQVRNKLAAAVAVTVIAAGLPLAAIPSDTAEAAASTAPAWTIQPGGTLGFAVANAADTITGNFGKWGGTINFDPDSPAGAAIHIDVDLTSAKIGDSFKDDLLQGDEFFGTAGTPTATYESTSVEKQTDGSFLAHGNLNLHGMSMAQDVKFKLNGSGAQRHVEGSASVERLAYAVGTGSHSGDLAPAVTVNFSFDATRK
jgi:polyisoprenoid-binding protein YceI